jgi:hypothetical protein
MRVLVQDKLFLGKDIIVTRRTWVYIELVSGNMGAVFESILN